MTAAVSIVDRFRSGTAVILPPPRGWPVLDDAALHGLPGEIVRAIEPQTEADPAAILAQLLTMAGNAIGGGPHSVADGDAHHANLFVAIVGDTAKARKGTSLARVRSVLEPAAGPAWKDRIVSGLSSGEGLIHAVRDGGQGNPDNPEDADPGVQDKRLLVVATEMVSALKVMERAGNTLSPVIRDAWDARPLQVLTKNSPAKATDPHISIIGHISIEELLRNLGATDTANGFANRFLFMLARRSRLLAEGGGAIDGLDGITGRLQRALEAARAVGVMSRDEKARDIWRTVYPRLSSGATGMFGAVTARAEAQVTRLSLLYALLDGSVSVKPEHLAAALAVWEYAETSARYIFGDATGDPNADKIERALREKPDGLSRSDISYLFSRHARSDEIDRALDFLERLRRAHKVTRSTDGRPAEVWKAGPAAEGSP